MPQYIGKYKIIKKLGHGCFGTVFLGEYSGKKYAVKVEKISAEDAKNKSLGVSHYFQIDFFKTMGKNRHLMTLHDSFIDENCTHKQPIPKDAHENMKKHAKEQNKHKTCSVLVYDVKDGSVDSIINKMSYEQLLSMICQIVYILGVLKKKKYVHGDTNLGNIGYVKTNIKTISLGKIRVPTGGYIFSLIDYGSLRHSKQKLLNNSKTKYEFRLKIGYDIQRFAFALSNVYDILKMNRASSFEKGVIEEKVRNLPEWSIIKTFDTTHEWYIVMLMSILNKHATFSLYSDQDKKNYNQPAPYVNRSILWMITENGENPTSVLKMVSRLLN